MESQLRTLTEYCQKQGLNNFLTFTDEGVSGAKYNRPALDKMMGMVREGKVEKVIVYSFSRFARSVTHLLSALEEFRSLNISFLSYTEQVDTNSPMGRAFFTVIAAISQLERELIVERVKNGLRNAKAKGVHIGRKKTRPSELIRTLRRSGLSYSAIAKITNVSEGAIGAELAAWREELARASRTISDEMAAHTAEKLSKGAAAPAPSEETDGGIVVSPGGPSLELELIR
jgi:DNA invertase Pin-like site-specific DNA recombinase